jgi:HAAS
MSDAANLAAPAQLTTYLAEISDALPGPRGHRYRVLAELRDGLDTGVAAHIDRGLSQEDAVRAAIDDFGSPDAVAAAFAPELAIVNARRTLLWYLVTGPLIGVWWLLLLQPRPWRAGPAAVLAAIPPLPLVVVAVCTAIGIVATTGRLMRWLPEATAGQAVAGSATVAALAVTTDLVMISMYLRSGQPMHPVGVIAVAASATRFVCSAILLSHLVARRRPAAPAI